MRSTPNGGLRLRVERAAALVERAARASTPPFFEQVVGHEDDGNGAHHLRDLLLPADPLLQRGKGQRPIVAEREHLAVEHGAVGQLRRRGGDLRKARRDRAPRRATTGAPRRRAAPAARECRPTSIRRATRRAAPSVSIGSSSGAARKNGYGRERSSSVCACESRPLNHSAVGVHSPMSRAAIVVGGSSAACASARTTSVCETPTRSSPVRIFSRMKRCDRSSARHQLVTRTCCDGGSSSRSGRMRVSTHAASGTSSTASTAT